MAIAIVAVARAARYAASATIVGVVAHLNAKTVANSAVTHAMPSLAVVAATADGATRAAVVAVRPNVCARAGTIVVAVVARASAGQARVVGPTLVAAVAAIVHVTLRVYARARALR